MWRLRVLIFMMQFCASKTLLHIIFFPQDFCLFTFMEDLPNKDYLGGMHLFCHGFKNQTVGAWDLFTLKSSQLGWAWLSHTLELNSLEVHEITTKSSKKKNILFHESKILRLVFHLLMINFHCTGTHRYISFNWVNNIPDVLLLRSTQKCGFDLFYLP